MNKWWHLGLALLVLLATTGCASSNASSNLCALDATPRVAIVSALEAELLPLLEQASITACTYEGVQYHVGVLAGHDVVLYHSGVGLDSAAEALTGALERFKVSAIVVSGIAGGISPHLGIGDVAVPSQWARYDGADVVWYASDPGMLALAEAAASKVVLDRCTPESGCLEEAPSVALNGRGVSGARFVDNAELRNRIWGEFGADTVDMETAAIAKIAVERGISFVAFRSVSDLAGGGGGGNEINVFRSLASGNSALYAVIFLESWEQSP